MEKKFDELGEFSGTGVLSYKVDPDVLVYGSYSRGYKAGGFNLDRSALKAPIAVINGVPTSTFAAAGGAQALVRNLQFDPELVGGEHPVKRFVHAGRGGQVLLRLTARQRLEPAQGRGVWNELDRLLFRGQAEMRTRKRRHF